MKSTTRLFLVSSAAFFLSTTNAQEVSREEYNALLKRVQMLEQKLDQTHEQQIETIANEVAQRTAASQQPVEQKPGLIENVIDAIQFRQEAATFPWMDAGKWAGIEKGMSLGE